MKKNIIKKILTLTLAVAFLTGGTLSALAASDTSPNAIPSRNRSSSKAEDEESKDTTTNKPTEATSTTKPKYGLLQDGNYQRTGSDWIDAGISIRTTTPAAKPGAQRKTESVTQSEFMGITFKDSKKRTITYDAVFEWQKDDKYLPAQWVNISPDPFQHVPMGYALAIGHIKVSDLPEKARKWHDVGAYDSVIYYPVLNEYYYGNDLKIKFAIALGFTSLSELDTKQREAYNAGAGISYSIKTGKFMDNGMTAEQGIKAGLITPNDMPADVRKSYDLGKPVSYYHTTNKYIDFDWVEPTK